MLLNNVEDLIAYLGRAVMSATTDEFMRPYIDQAQEDILERAIGANTVHWLEQKMADPMANEATQKLIKKAQRALAWYAYLKYLPYSIGNDGDNGLQEMGTDSTQPVRIGVLDKRTRETERNAVNSLESLLQYLEANLDEFPEYAGSDFAKEARALFVPSATIMSEFLPQISGNYRLFLTLRPWLKMAERDYILPRLGSAQFSRLKEGLKERSLTDKEQDLLFSVRRALSLTAYWIALPSLQLVILGNGNLRILSDFDGIYNSKAPSNETIMSLTRSAETEAKKWQNGMNAFLQRHLDDFPLYAQSMEGKASPVNRLPDNEQYSSIFRMK